MQKVLVLVLLLCVVPPCLGYMTDISANTDFCVYEHFDKNTKVDGAFHVTKGKTLFVNFRIKAPNNKQIYSVSHRSEGKYSFMADSEGEYALCFENDNNARKTVAFHITTKSVGTAERAKETKDLFVSDIEDIRERVEAVQLGQRFLIERDARVRHTVQRTSSRVRVWTAVESIAVLAIAAAQVLFFRHVVERKRQVAV